VQELAYRAVLNVSRREETERRQKAVPVESGLLCNPTKYLHKGFTSEYSGLQGVMRSRGRKLPPRVETLPTSVVSIFGGKLNLQFDREGLKLDWTGLPRT